jgi:hypothetical protein
MGAMIRDEGAQAKTRSGFCINCDNRHGCKSKTPPCIVLMTREHAGRTTGKEYLVERGMIDECLSCPFFRSCWNGDDYDRAAEHARKGQAAGRQGR